MAGALKYDRIIKYQATATCLEPLHIGSAVGMKEEVLVHPVDEMPFIQATSIVGVFRDYFTRARGWEEASRLFGADKFSREKAGDGKQSRSGEDTAEAGGKDAGNMESTPKECDPGSKVRFTEGTFLTQKHGVRMELRPRLAINPETGTCQESMVKGTDRNSGHKFNMEYVGAGAEFVFSVYLYDESYQKDIEDIFAALNSEDIQFGGQKSNGCGYVKIGRLERASFDMRKGADRERWAREDTLSAGEYEDITEELPKKGSSGKAYEIIVSGRTEGELLVKGIAAIGDGKKELEAMDDEEKLPDAVNIRNAKGEYIVPGSSLKGAVRSQMEKIAAYMGCKEVIQATFGEKSSDGKKSRTGNISFFDTVVGKVADNDKAPMRYRIHIDKFTGGVMNSALFNERNVSGELQLHIVIADKNEPDKSCGLLLLALRDLSIGAMSLGSGYNIGKGILEVDTIAITEKSGREAVIDYRTKETADSTGLIPEILGALKG